MSEYEYTQSHDIPIEEKPDRVVSLVPSVTETLFELTLGDRLVGRTDYCVRPAGKVDAIETIGGPKNPDVARILAMKPELVIANQEENRQEDVEALQAAGIPVWVTYPRTVPDVFNLLWDVMYLFDETTMAPRVRLIEQTYDWVVGITRANEHNPVTVFCPIWHEPLMTFNADTYAHHLLAVCGGTNVFAAHDNRYPTVTLDDVVAMQPDVILLPDEPFQFTEMHIPVFQQLDVPAAKNSRIHFISGADLTWHGTRIAFALDHFPSLLEYLEES